MLEPGEQPPERIVCRGNERRVTPPGTELRPGHVRPQPRSDPVAGGDGRGDERLLEGKSPRGPFALEAAPAASYPDEVTDLVEGDEVTHLAANGRDADLESPLRAAVAVSNANDDGAASTPGTSDAVLRAQVVDVEIEGLRLHRASVMRAAEVTPLPFSR